MPSSDSPSWSRFEVARSVCQAHWTPAMWALLMDSGAEEIPAWHPGSWASRAGPRTTAVGWGAHHQDSRSHTWDLGRGL